MGVYREAKEYIFFFLIFESGFVVSLYNVHHKHLKQREEERGKAS